MITPELALKVGQATGVVFRRAGDDRHRVVIGKDTRLSGYMIETALIAGFTSVGMDVLQLGPMPTPAVAMLTRSMRADLGVMISASHNPFDDNGIKLFGPDGYKLSDEVEHQIESLIDSDMTKRLAKSRELAAPSVSTASTTATSNSPSVRCRATSRSRPARRHRLRPGCRLSGGAGGAVGARRRRHRDRRRAGRLQHQPRVRSTTPDALCRKVREMRADIGIALDGDDDRVSSPMSKAT